MGTNGHPLNISSQEAHRAHVTEHPPVSQAGKIADEWRTPSGIVPMNSDWREPMKRTITPCLLILIAASIALTGGCAKKITPPQTPQTSAISLPTPGDTAPVSGDALSLLEVKIDSKKNGRYVIKGRFSNSSPRLINNVSANFSLLDRSGKEIGQATAIVENLKAGFSWNFEVEIMQANAVSAKLIGITAKQ
jgi:hypothetical protein